MQTISRAAWTKPGTSGSKQPSPTKRKPFTKMSKHSKSKAADPEPEAVTNSEVAAEVPAAPPEPLTGIARVKAELFSGGEVAKLCWQPVVQASEFNISSKF